MYARSTPRAVFSTVVRNLPFSSCSDRFLPLDTEPQVPFYFATGLTTARVCSHEDLPLPLCAGLAATLMHEGMQIIFENVNYHCFLLSLPEKSWTTVEQ